MFRTVPGWEVSSIGPFQTCSIPACSKMRGRGNWSIPNLLNSCLACSRMRGKALVHSKLAQFLFVPGWEAGGEGGVARGAATAGAAAVTDGRVSQAAHLWQRPSAQGKDNSWSSSCHSWSSQWSCSPLTTTVCWRLRRHCNISRQSGEVKAYLIHFHSFIFLFFQVYSKTLWTRGTKVLVHLCLIFRGLYSQNYRWQSSRAGKSLIGFLSESLVFCKKMRELAIR